MCSILNKTIPHETIFFWSLSVHNSIYALCLRLVCKILDDDKLFAKQEDFTIFGKISHICDHHLDNLSPNQLVLLSKNYLKYFLDLTNRDNLNEFTKSIKNIEFELELIDNLSQEEISTMLALFQICKAQKLIEDLQVFGQTMIFVALDKRTNTNVQKGIELLRIEGAAAITFIAAYSQISNHTRKGNLKTFKYLQFLESLVNVGDDIIDYWSDKRKGLLSTNLGILYPPLLIVAFISNLFGVLVHFPFRFIRDLYFFGGEILSLYLQPNTNLKQSYENTIPATSR